jgi:hypothetical protein
MYRVAVCPYLCYDIVVEIFKFIFIEIEHKFITANNMEKEGATCTANVDCGLSRVNKMWLRDNVLLLLATKQTVFMSRFVFIKSSSTDCKICPIILTTIS